MGQAASLAKNSHSPADIVSCVFQGLAGLASVIPAGKILAAKAKVLTKSTTQVSRFIKYAGTYAKEIDTGIDVGAKCGQSLAIVFDDTKTKEEREEALVGMLSNAIVKVGTKNLDLKGKIPSSRIKATNTLLYLRNKKIPKDVDINATKIEKSSKLTAFEQIWDGFEENFYKKSIQNITKLGMNKSASLITSVYHLGTFDYLDSNFLMVDILGIVDVSKYDSSLNISYVTGNDTQSDLTPFKLGDGKYYDYSTYVKRILKLKARFKSAFSVTFLSDLYLHDMRPDLTINRVVGLYSTGDRYKSLKIVTWTGGVIYDYYGSTPVDFRPYLFEDNFGNVIWPKTFSLGAFTQLAIYFTDNFLSFMKPTVCKPLFDDRSKLYYQNQDKTQCIKGGTTDTTTTGSTFILSGVAGADMNYLLNMYVSCAKAGYPSCLGNYTNCSIFVKSVSVINNSINGVQIIVTLSDSIVWGSLTKKSVNFFKSVPIRPTGYLLYRNSTANPIKLQFLNDKTVFQTSIGEFQDELYLDVIRSLTTGSMLPTVEYLKGTSWIGWDGTEADQSGITSATQFRLGRFTSVNYVIASSNITSLVKTTTTPTMIDATSKTITVKDTTGIQIGQYIVYGNGLGQYENKSNFVTGISGTTITLSASLSTLLPNSLLRKKDFSNFDIDITAMNMTVSFFEINSNCSATMGMEYSKPAGKPLSNPRGLYFQSMKVVKILPDDSKFASGVIDAIPTCSASNIADADAVAAQDDTNNVSSMSSKLLSIVKESPRNSAPDLAEVYFTDIGNSSYNWNDCFLLCQRWGVRLPELADLQAYVTYNGSISKSIDLLLPIIGVVTKNGITKVTDNIFARVGQSSPTPTLVANLDPNTTVKFLAFLSPIYLGNTCIPNKFLASLGVQQSISWSSQICFTGPPTCFKTANMNANVKRLGALNMSGRLGWIDMRNIAGVYGSLPSKLDIIDYANNILKKEPIPGGDVWYGLRCILLVLSLLSVLSLLLLCFKYNSIY